MRLAGRQDTAVTVNHAGTPEATVVVQLGRAVVYLHSMETADRFASYESQPPAIRVGSLPSTLPRKRVRLPIRFGRQFVAKWCCLPLPPSLNPACQVSNHRPGRTGFTRSSTRAIG